MGEVRRTLSLRDGRKEDLEAIKAAMGMKTDVAAINDAVEFRAQLVGRPLAEVKEALHLYDEVRRNLTKGRMMFFLDDEPGENVQVTGIKVLVPVLSANHVDAAMRQKPLNGTIDADIGAGDLRENGEEGFDDRHPKVAAALDKESLVPA